MNCELSWASEGDNNNYLVNVDGDKTGFSWEDFNIDQLTTWREDDGTTCATEGCGKPIGEIGTFFNNIRHGFSILYYFNT